MSHSSSPGVAIIHDWILTLRGGERVLDELCALYPRARLYTLFYRRGAATPRIDGMDVHASWLNRLPGSHRAYRLLLPISTRVVERFQVQSYPLVISSSHAVAKGVHPHPSAVHLCYCMTPMRYAWDDFEDYRHPARTAAPVRAGLRVFRAALQQWDRASSGRVTAFAAISQHIADRIRRCYDRQATVIYPPVRTDRFTPAHVPKRDDFYLLVSALVPYKRVDLAIEAFNRLRRPLWIVGRGPLEARLRRQAGSTIRFLGWIGDTALLDLYRRARALVHPSREEFGLAPVEAQACGTPVVGFAHGSLAETVVDGVCGVLFPAQDAETLVAAIERLDRLPVDRALLRAQALRFSVERFQREFTTFVARHYPAIAAAPPESGSRHPACDSASAP